MHSCTRRLRETGTVRRRRGGAGERMSSCESAEGFMHLSPTQSRSRVGRPGSSCRECIPETTSPRKRQWSQVAASEAVVRECTTRRAATGPPFLLELRLGLVFRPLDSTPIMSPPRNTHSPHHRPWEETDSSSDSESGQLRHELQEHAKVMKHKTQL